MSLFRSVVLPMLLASSLAAQSPPTRQVHGDTLVSPADPSASLIFTPAFRYAGSQAIDIFKIAGAEQYFFIDAAPDSSIRRFYWIQFEHFYPTNDKTYNYSGIEGQKPVMLGRLSFMGDIRVRASYFTHDNRPGSDSKAAEDFLRAKGFNIDGTFATLRLFHLPDATRRSELMIIYGEVVPDSAAEARMRSEIIAHGQSNIAIR